MTDDFELCTQRDDFIWDKPVWVAELLDGTEVWQDDDRPGVSEPSAWIRLGDYVKATDNHIKQLQVRFRTHQIFIPKTPIYYYTKGILGSTGMIRPIHFYCVGHLDKEDVFEINWFKIPELIATRRTTKPLSEVHGPEIIRGEHV